MIIKVQGGGGGTYANTGTSEVVVNYLQHEDFKRMQENRKIEHFFSQAEDRVKPQEVWIDYLFCCLLHDTSRLPYVCVEKLQSKESTGRMIIR